MTDVSREETPPPAAPAAPVEAREPERFGHPLFLVVILLLALFLRLREPLSSPIIAAEDPYLHMERTWDLIQGREMSAPYPVGFPALLVPFAFLGEETFYYVVRFLPPFLGVIQVAGVFLLCREHLRPVGAYTGALLVAVMPENIFRTNILFPTAVDLAALPFLMLLLLRAARDDRRALLLFVVAGFAFLFLHPWFSGLLLPVALVFLGTMYLRQRTVRPIAVGGVAVSLLGLMAVISILPNTFNPVTRFTTSAWPRAQEIAADPSLLLVMPPYVDLPAMLTVAALALALLGAFVALRDRTRFGLLALLWTLLLLPLVLVDWFGVWFIPHRTVAFMSIGIAMLGALPADWLARRIPAPEGKRFRATFYTLGIVLALTLPSALGMQSWYRLYDQNDYDAWHGIEAEDPSVLIVGTWEQRAGYRAITGGQAVYVARFYTDANVREDWLARYPDLIVLVDDRTRRDELPTGWLRGEGWHEIGAWGDVRAYTAPDA